MRGIDGDGGRSSLPASMVTFLVADFDRSATLWEAAPEAMAAAFVMLCSILYEAVSRRGGVPWRDEGERKSILAVFAQGPSAADAALDAQRALSAQSWPEGLDLRVRIALHSAIARLEPDEEHFGAAFSRCARLQSIGRGGQTLVSGSMHELIVDRLPDGAELIDLGTHRLGDLRQPERVYQLAHRDLPADLGPLRSLDALPNNLPDQPTTFIGRERELRDIGAALQGTRLLTLTGSGGCGKTRLALQTAADSLEQFPDGAWWIGLAQLEAPALIGQALAGVLGVRPLPGRSALDAAIAHLAERRTLLVLDNCEHLLEGAANTAELLLGNCGDVTVMATSRAPLDLDGEIAWRVPSLSLPAGNGTTTAAALAESDASQLFVSRALKIRPNLQVTDQSAPTITRICSELDGIPLAIELAAARVRMLSLEQIAAGLEDRFRILTGAVRTDLPRHQTLRASIDWSHELLSKEERMLFRRLAVFRGGFTLDLCEEVACGEGLERITILDLLTSLVDKSLVVAEERGSAIRYRLLETVRQYAFDLLSETGESETVRDRHRDAFLELGERTGPKVVVAGQAKWLALLDAEAANFSAALDWAAATDANGALRLCFALTPWWRLHGRFADGERGFGRALDAADPAPSPLRARVLWGRGYLLTFAGEYARAIATTQEALSIAEEVDDEFTIARALHVLGQIQVMPDPVRSRRGLERSRELARAGHDDFCFIAATHVLAQSYQLCDEYEEADRLFEEARPYIERKGFGGFLAFRWVGKSVEALMRGDAERLFTFVDRALVASAEVGEPITEGMSHTFAALFELAQGRATTAITRLEICRERMITKGAGMALHYSETALAAAYATTGDLDRARARLGTVIESGADFGHWLAWTTAQLADVLRISRDEAEAEKRAREALEISERVGSRHLTAWCREILGRLKAAQGEWGEAEALLHEALAPRVECKLWLYLPRTLDELAAVAAGLESYEESARLLGAVEGGRAKLRLVRWAPDHPRFVALEGNVREALGGEAFEAARAEGAALSLEEAAAWVRRARGTRKRPSGGWESLTPTELEVVRHAAAGLTNPQIGERMFISRGTVKVHLSHIYAKLDIRNRAELAAEAARRLPTQAG
jgi:predicted ATPase/DNA-binding CsgD family transcriptional regulator/class 3 adenylate cyclase